MRYTACNVMPCPVILSNVMLSFKSSNKFIFHGTPFDLRSISEYRHNYNKE